MVKLVVFTKSSLLIVVSGIVKLYEIQDVLVETL